MPYLEILRKLAVPAAVITLVLTIWFSGDHHGQAVVNLKWSQAKAAEAAARQAEHERVFRQEQAYADQLARAKSESDHNRTELARLRSAPRPRVLCYADATSDPHTLPGLPAPAAGEAPRSGLLPQTVGQDLTNDFYLLADDADDAIEAARDALARWPK